ncbi:hypothetical protein FRC12_005634 [Ceratobasidium sp. 428]|nr:hypothetical protein FRC12_005634 [Ceratobasidium sp. 428]
MPQIQACPLLRIDTPINHLPDPVISEVFIFACRNWYTRSDNSWCGMRVPYTLASVSHRWRAIALSTSQIWSFVDLSLRPELLPNHLTRSKNVPINAKLVLGENSNADGVQESLRILSEKSAWSRLRYLDAMVGLERPILSGQFIDAFNAAFEANPTSVFETISMVILTEDVDAGPGDLHLHVPSSRVLRTISMFNVGLSPIPHLPSSPLPRLERLELDHASIRLLDSLLPLLELTPNLVLLSLEECRLQSRSNITITSRPRHSVPLANLRTLKLCDIKGPVELNTMFQVLNMPNLQYLIFSLHDTRLDWSAIRHCRTLQYLYLKGFTSEHLAGLLPHIDALGQLEQFILHPGYLTTPHDFVDQLARKLLETPDCPRLKDLKIRFPLNSQVMETITELTCARPSLIIYLESDESDNEDITGDDNQ